MIGCVLATVGVIGLLKMAHHHRHGCGGGWRGHFRHHHLRRCGGGWGHHRFDRGEDGGGDEWGEDGGQDLGDGFGVAMGLGGPRGFGRRIIMRRVLDGLETTPAQEKVIFAAAEEFRTEAAKFRGELRKSRGDVAAAFRKPSFDEVMLGELYARHDTAIEGLRRAFVGIGRQGPRHPGREAAGAAGRPHRVGSPVHGRLLPAEVFTWRLRSARPGLVESGSVSLRVLCIDDDTRLFELLASFLEPNGVGLVHAADGRQGLAALEVGVFDAVLLDVMMPGIDGLEVCKRIRQKSQVPVIMLTAKGDETDRVVGLELGADDYVPKPFSPRELLARLRAVLRRTSPEAAAPTLVVRDIVIDVAARDVRVAGAAVELTGIEFDILLTLARRPGRVVPRDTLLAQAGRGRRHRGRSHRRRARVASAPQAGRRSARAAHHQDGARRRLRAGQGR